jgi:hypothetical protein
MKWMLVVYICSGIAGECRTPPDILQSKTHTTSVSKMGWVMLTKYYLDPIVYLQLK